MKYPAKSAGCVRGARCFVATRAHVVVKGRVARSGVSDLLASGTQPFDGGALVTCSQSGATGISACQRRKSDIEDSPVQSRVVGLED